MSQGGAVQRLSSNANDSLLISGDRIGCTPLLILRRFAVSILAIASSVRVGIPKALRNPANISSSNAYPETLPNLFNRRRPRPTAQRHAACLTHESNGFRKNLPDGLHD